MTELTFEEPPKAQHGKSTVDEQAQAIEQLRKRPGQWAVVTVEANCGNAGQFAYTVRKGLRRIWGPAGTFEAVSRKVDGEYRVYARFVGAKTSE